MRYFLVAEGAVEGGGMVRAGETGLALTAVPVLELMIRKG